MTYQELMAQGKVICKYCREKWGALEWTGGEEMKEWMLKQYEKRKKRDMGSADWYMLLSLFMVVWLLMVMRYWNE